MESFLVVGTWVRVSGHMTASDWLLQGMVLVSPKMNPTICCQFEAAIVLLFHAKTFRRGSQVTVHVGNVRQTATVECLQGKVSSAPPTLENHAPLCCLM